MLENDTKTFEDLEFQYLEEETDWLAYREDLHSEQKTLSRRISEKHKHIESLETQGIDNQNAACNDTKNIEKDLLSMLKELEKCREQLKTIDTLLYELSGEQNAQSDSDEELSETIARVNRPHNDVMSQSLFGSQDVLNAKKHQTNDLMSKSVNENLFSNKIESLSFNEHVLPKTETEANVNYENQKNQVEINPMNNASTEKPNLEKRNSNIEMEMEQITEANDNGNSTSEIITATTTTPDPLQKLKYNLSPPFEHKVNADVNDSNGKAVNLNLSIESDDFEVNPLEKRVPSQDDIDRICKVTSDHKISTTGASFKVIESIKEIERNRQLLLAQQGKFSLFF